MHPSELGRATSAAPTIDACAIVPILASVYAAIVAPLLIYFGTPSASIQTAEPGLSNRIVWPVLTAVSIGLLVRNYSRFARLTLAPHIICLLAYVAFAGASVVWAFRPATSLIRYVQEVMVLTSIVLPAMLAVRTADLMRGLFLCFGSGAILHILFVPSNPEYLVNWLHGYIGYFLHKNTLGEFSTIAVLLALHEVLYSGRRRALGIVIFVIATLLLDLSNSKTAFGLAFICPLLAGVILIIRKTTRISAAVVLLSIVFCYAIFSSVSGFNTNQVSLMVYGDPTFTGRTVIWDFALREIAQRPLLGWGYQSFWLVGFDAPSVTEAPGFVKTMPNAHNGYYDTMLELGYVGYGFLLIFIIATIHAIGRVADRDFRRAWCLLSLALYVIIYNYLESFWLRGFEFVWVVFVTVVAEIGRHWQPFRPTGPVHGWSTPRPGNGGGRSRGARMPGPRIWMKAPGPT